MRESLTHTSRKCVFRETFEPASIARNGGVITGGVTLNDGVATFDGSTGYITYAGNKELSNKSQFTIRWKSKRAALNSMVTIGTVGGGSTNRTDMVYYSDGKLYAIFHNSSISSSHAKVNTNTTAWVEAVVVFDGTQIGNENRVKVYLGGVVQSPIFTTAVPNATFSGGDLIIGSTQDGFTTGSFELVEIYDSAISPEEISLLSRNALYKGAVR